MKEKPASRKAKSAVKLFALGYEWGCPECKAHNTVLAIPKQVTCVKCHRSFWVARSFHTYA